MLLNAKRNFAVRLSHVLFFVDDPSEVNEFFEGFSISGYYHLGQKIINPYVGVGVFSGEIYNCSREDENRGLCDNKFVLAIYPEFGVAFNIGNVQIYPFVRRYYDTNSPTGNISAYGLHLGLKY
ncbi:MAG: hypothetical protein COA99_00740 [Moraxellaceae bacterium]|nr:MAG: hypothetical protein COA99_00740 [Moraxellaceae bacterium]